MALVTASVSLPLILPIQNVESLPPVRTVEPREQDASEDREKKGNLNWVFPFILHRTNKGKSIQLLGEIAKAK